MKNKIIIRSTERIDADTDRLISDTVEFLGLKYTVKEDEPEDMIFGRSLEDTGNIVEMIKKAFWMGYYNRSGGIEVEVITKEI